MSRRKPYFVFAGREFFQQTNDYAPLYQRGLVTSVSVLMRYSRMEKGQALSTLGWVTAISTFGFFGSIRHDYIHCDWSRFDSFPVESSFPVGSFLVPPRPQTSKSTQQSSVIRFGTRSIASDEPPVRISSAMTTSSKTQMSERERRDAMRLQRQLNLPRQGWVNQQRA